MEEMKQTTVVMTAEEKAEFEAFQREKAKKAAEEKAKNDREMYKQMVDEGDSKLHSGTAGHQ